MDSGIETSPIPSFQPGVNGDQNDLREKGEGVDENKMKGAESDNPVMVSVYDSNSETDGDCGDGDRQFLIPNPEPNVGLTHGHGGPAPVSQYGSIQAREDRDSTSSVTTNIDQGKVVK